MKYILTDEDGFHRLISELTEDMVQTICDGYFTAIRISDLKQMNNEGEWVDIESFEEE